MIDTIVLQSDYLQEHIAQRIEKTSIERMGYDFELDQLLYTFTNKELKGSYDSSIRISLLREEWVSILDTNINKKIAIKRKCKPYIQIECSLHKFFLGHNIYGGSNDIEFQVQKLIMFIEDQFKVELPNYKTFSIMRIDYARVYDIGEQINLFFEGFSNIYYPRRTVMKYGKDGLYFPGTTTTLKLYNKYNEFKKHDRKRLRKVLYPKELQQLEKIAKGKLRIELEIKGKKLKDMYKNEYPKVDQIKIKDIEEQFNVEILRVFKMGEKTMKIYNKSHEVEKRIYERYGSTGNTFLATWYKLSLRGYEYVKDSMPKSTFYYHINKLRDIGISWNHTDIVISDTKVIDFIFNPITTDLEVKIDLIAS